MKYIVALALGLISGAVIFAAAIVYNPFSVDRALSPLSVSESEVIVFNFSAVPADSIIYTNNGESIQSPIPTMYCSYGRHQFARRVRWQPSCAMHAIGQSASVSRLLRSPKAPTCCVARRSRTASGTSIRPNMAACSSSKQKITFILFAK